MNCNHDRFNYGNYPKIEAQGGNVDASINRVRTNACHRLLLLRFQDIPGAFGIWSCLRNIFHNDTWESMKAMVHTHCTGLGTGTGPGTVDFYIMLCTVHITLRLTMVPAYCVLLCQSRSMYRYWSRSLAVWLAPLVTIDRSPLLVV